MFHNTNIQEIFKYPLQFRLCVGKKEGRVVYRFFILLPPCLFLPSLMLVRFLNKEEVTGLQFWRNILCLKAVENKSMKMKRSS